jgi:hypothetical protein
MKITKEEALALTKILHQHVGGLYSLSGVEKNDFLLTLEGVSERLDDFLIFGDDEADEDDEDEEECCDCGHPCGKEDEDEEAEDDDEDEEDSSSKGNKEDAEAEDEAEEASEEDDSDDEEDAEELEPDGDVDSLALHDLKPTKAKEGTLEFEACDGVVDLLVDSYAEHGATHLKRKGKELHVRDDAGKWHVYHVARFPKAWTDLLAAGELLEVSGE